MAPAQIASNPAAEQKKANDKIIAPQINQLNRTPLIITTANDFAIVFNGLLPNERDIFFNANRDILPSLVKNALDFHFIMGAIARSPELSKVAFNILRGILPKIIKGVTEFRMVFNDLFEAEQNILFADLKNQIIDLIKSASDFYLTLNILTKQQQNLLLQDEKLTDKIPDVLVKGIDYYFVLAVLTQPQRNNVFENLWPPEKFTDALDFYWGVYYLTPEQRGLAVNDLMQENKLLPLINNAADFQIILSPLSPQQRSFVYANQSIRRKILTLIETPSDFCLVTQHLLPIERMVIFNEAFRRLVGSIKTVEDLNYLQEQLNYEPQFNELCKAILEAFVINLREQPRGRISIPLFQEASQNKETSWINLNVEALRAPQLREKLCEILNHIKEAPNGRAAAAYGKIKQDFSENTEQEEKEAPARQHAGDKRKGPHR